MLLKALYPGVRLGELPCQALLRHFVDSCNSWPDQSFLSSLHDFFQKVILWLFLINPLCPQYKFLPCGYYGTNILWLELEKGLSD